jgi:hypothetical protein
MLSKRPFKNRIRFYSMHSLFFFLRDLLSSRAMTFKMWSVAWDRWLFVYNIENFEAVKLSLSWATRWFARWWGQGLGSLIIEKMSACNTIALFFVLTNILYFLLELFSSIQKVFVLVKNRIRILTVVKCVLWVILSLYLARSALKTSYGAYARSYKLRLKSDYKAEPITISRYKAVRYHYIASACYIYRTWNEMTFLAYKRQ